MKPIPITRRRVRFLPDTHRVIAKPYLPGEQVFPDGQSRVELVIKRILAMPESEVASTLAGVRERFTDRHMGLDSILEGNFAVVADHIDNPDDLSPERRLLIGGYFTHEYSIEAAAMADACSRAFSLTGDERWRDLVDRAARWFVGDNDGEALLYNTKTGGGRDGLTPGGTNPNQGAESTLAALAALQQAQALYDHSD